jgi:hypothetical protein
LVELLRSWINSLRKWFGAWVAAWARAKVNEQYEVAWAFGSMSRYW